MEKTIIKLIKDLYTFHDYEISRDKAHEIARILIETKPPKDEAEINLFFEQVKMGKFGTLYRVPTCLTSMYYKSTKTNKSPFITF